MRRRFAKRLLTLGLAATLTTTHGCAALFVPKDVELEAVPSDATIEVDGAYYGEGLATFKDVPGLPRTMRVTVKPPEAPPYEVSISNQGDYSLWWFSLLWAAMGAGFFSIYASDRNHENANSFAAMGLVSLVYAPVPLLFNHKFENAYRLDAQARTATARDTHRDKSARQAALDTLSLLPTLREVYVRIDDHYLRRVSDDRLAQGALAAVLRTAGHADRLAAFSERPGLAPFERLAAAYRELGLDPLDRRLEYVAVLGMIDAMGDPLATFHLPAGVVPRPKVTPKPKPKPSPLTLPMPAGHSAATPAPALGQSGLHFDLASDRLVVKAVDVRSPAWRAGLRPGDRVVAIDGEPTATIRNEVARSWLYKPAGEAVTVKVQRDRGTFLERELTLLADDRPPLTVEEWAPDTLYFRVGDFGAALLSLDTELNAFFDHENPLIDLGRKNLVLDLRGEDSGDFGAIEQVGGMLLSLKSLGRVVGRHGRALNTAGLCKLPRHRKLIVLVDGTTAGGHEILAAALQDQHRAVVVGTPSYGFGFAYHHHRFPDGSRLVLPTGELLRHSGQRLSQSPVQPNVVVAPAVFDPAQDVADPLRAAAMALLREDLDAAKLEEKYRLK